LRIPYKSLKRRSGVAIVEFSLSVVVLVPLLLGTLVFGFRLIRSLQMEQIVRDLGHMYIRGVDFRPANPGPTLIAKTLAQSFDLTATGTSVVVLSKITLVRQSDCDAANPTRPVGTACNNLNNPVFMEQMMVGNTSLRINGVSSAKSQYGSPPLQADYTVTLADQANTPSAAAGVTTGSRGFAALMTLKAGEFAYVTEMINATAELNIPGLSGSPQVYARSVF
jgi:Flp pilus assembly protein TadG